MNECFFELNETDMENFVGGLSTKGWCTLGGVALGASIVSLQVGFAVGLALGMGMSGCWNFSNGC